MICQKMSKEHCDALTADLITVWMCELPYGPTRFDHGEIELCEGR